VPIVEWLNGKWSDFKEILKPEFAKGFVKPNTENVEIKYPGTATGKFVALYGFDELFEVLPESITRLNIINTSNERIILNIPDSITRFKSLKAVLFENVINTLPDALCQIKSLLFIAAPNNSELKSVPDCIMTLPNLTFVNVNRCPNVKVPASLEPYATGGGFYHMEE
jgi:Leucine-rich repeat (LRR) protein